MAATAAGMEEGIGSKQQMFAHLVGKYTPPAVVDWYTFKVPALIAYKRAK